MPALDDDTSYFRQRARQCRAQAVISRDPAVRQIHRRFAAAYEQRLIDRTGREDDTDRPMFFTGQ